MSLHRLFVLAAALLGGALPSAGFAQQYQYGWSISSSQGRSSSSSAVQGISSSAVNLGVQLVNAEATSQPGVYRIIDPTQPFLALEDSTTSVSSTDSRSGGYSTFSGTGASVFHLPVTP